MEERQLQLRSLLFPAGTEDQQISVETLMDALVAVYDDCKVYSTAEKHGPIPRFLNRCAKYRDIDSKLTEQMARRCSNCDR
jgi:hypothetical protein